MHYVPKRGFLGFHKHSFVLNLLIKFYGSIQSLFFCFVFVKEKSLDDQTVQAEYLTVITTAFISRLTVTLQMYYAWDNHLMFIKLFFLCI